MPANLRIRLGLRMVVGPLHPSAKADVFLTVSPEADGTARVDITRINFPGNAIFTAVGGFLKDRLTSQINILIGDALKDIPKYVPQVEQVTILEVSSD
ncbi:MAG TPA: hypothetical protein VF313_09505 [Anaerolineaceae bacterium]